jgi:hypothetical protein
MMFDPQRTPFHLHLSTMIICSVIGGALLPVVAWGIRNSWQDMSLGQYDWILPMLAVVTVWAFIVFAAGAVIEGWINQCENEKHRRD